jgi:hypothetical protein
MVRCNWMWIIKRIGDLWKGWKREEAAFVEFAELVERVREEFESEIEPLSLEEAKVRAERLLVDPSKFRCTVAADGNWPDLEQLAPLVRDLFRKYYEILQLPGDLMLAGTQIEPSLVDPAMLVIGSSGLEHQQLAVRPGEEVVYELDEEPSFDEDRSPILRFPSVYHCILYFDRYQALTLTPSTAPG